MSYPKTGQEVYVSLNLSNTMLTGIGKGTITREEVSVDYLKRLFAEHGVIVSAKPEQHRLLEIVNATFDLGLELPEDLKLFQLSEQHRRLVVINVQGLRRKGGSLLPEYSEEEFGEATTGRKGVCGKPGKGVLHDDDPHFSELFKVLKNASAWRKDFFATLRRGAPMGAPLCPLFCQNTGSGVLIPPGSRPPAPGADAPASPGSGAPAAPR